MVLGSSRGCVGKSPVAADANRRATGDADITAAGARVRTLVLTAREDIEIAGGTRRALRS